MPVAQRRSQSSHTMSSSHVYPGDEILSNPAMMYDRTRIIDAPASTVYPWLVQLGKGRGGWYLPSSIERFLPRTWRAAVAIVPAWQDLHEGDIVQDYGFSKDDTFTVRRVEPDRCIVFYSERYGAVFTWTLMLNEFSRVGRDGRERTVTEVHLRFRGRIASTGLKRRLLVYFGDKLDHWTTAPMLAGLAERAEECVKR